MYLYFSQATVLFSRKGYFKLVCNVYTSKGVKYNHQVNYEVFLM